MCQKVGIFDNGGQFVSNQGVNWWKYGKILSQ